MLITYFLKFLKEFSFGYRRSLFVLLLSSFVAGFLEFLGITLVFPLILVILKPDILTSISYLSFVCDKFSFTSVAVVLSGLIVGAFVIKNLFIIAETRYRFSLLRQWRANIKVFLFKKYLFSSYQSKSKLDSKYSIMQMNELLDMGFLNFVQRVLHLISCCIVLAIIFVFMVWKFKIWAILTSLFFVFAGYFQNKFFKTKGRHLTQKMVEFVDKHTKTLLPLIRNVKDIKIFGRENYFVSKYDKLIKEKSKVDADIEFYTAIPQNIVELCIIFAILIMCYGIVSMSSGNSDEIVASFGLLVAVMFRMAPVVNKVQVHMNFINSSKPTMDALFEGCAEYNKMEVVSSITNEIQPFNNELNIKDLIFRYDEKNILEGVNLKIKKGEFVGIIGASGVGKTTFLDILMGLLAPTSGEIFIDEEKLDEKNVQKWINAIGYVPQEVTTLPVSIAQNIAFGIDEEDIDYGKLMSVIKQTQLEAYVAGLPNGIDTVLSDLVQSLSQGQKQRIGIARALYKNSEILFLDEITSALDVETENKITDCLNHLKGEKTIIAIAHRISTLKKCDRILYFKSKDTVLTGTFEELSAQDEDFASIIKLSKL